MKKILLSSFLMILSGYLFATDLVPGQTYRVSLGKKVLTVENSSLSNQASVVTWTETNVNAQCWVLALNEEGGYQLVNAYSGKVLSRKGAVVNGAGIYQNDPKTASATGIWEIIPVENQNDLFYITQSKNATEKLYLEASSLTEDGAPIVLRTKKTGAGANSQMWKIEGVTAKPNYLTGTARGEMMDGWKRKYYKPASIGYVLGNGGWWGDAEMFEVVLDAYETTGNSLYKSMFEELYRNFIARNKTNWSYNDFNDDIAWMVLACVRAYLMFGDVDYLNKAKENFDMMYARAAVLPHGTLIWNEAENPDGTNSCINGPAEVAACYLAIATGNEAYYTKAKEMYAAQRQFLYKPTTGQVYDSFTWEGNTPVNYNYWASTYNQGTFLGAAVMLYNHFGDEQYKEDAKMIMKYAYDTMCDEFGIIKVCQVATGDLTGFKGILMRYARRFMVDLCQPEYVTWMTKNAFHAYNNRNAAGVSSSTWLTKTSENYIFGDSDFSNDPFGPSTAVSAAFNAYIGDKTIVKDAFSKIEAENFDYLKGIYVQTGTDDHTPELANIKPGFHTGYHNVNFGNNLAKSIEIRIAPQAKRCKIEIHLDSPTGKQIGLINVPEDNKEWQTVTQELATPVDGMRNIYFVYTGPATELMKINYFQFTTNCYIYSDVTDNGGIITSSLEPASVNEGLNALIDNRLTTKLRTSTTNSGPMWIQYQSLAPVALKGYALGSADDASEKDPKTWKLQASNDGTNWEDLDTQVGQVFETRYQKNKYNVSTTKEYTYFRLYITEKSGDTNELQLSEWQLYGNALSKNDITADGGVLSAQYTGNETEETYLSLIDKNVTSKYLVKGQSDLWIQYAANAIYTLSSYSITSAADAPERDPKDWTLYGSVDGINWVQVDRQLNQKFLYRNITHTYPCSVNARYRYFKLHINATNGATMTQLAEWQLSGHYYFDPFSNDITMNGGKLSFFQKGEASPVALNALTDNDGTTYCTLNATELPIQIQYQSPIPVLLRGYSIVAADEADKDPRKWILSGSNNNKDWFKITEMTTNFSLRGERKTYKFSTRITYTYFRLEIAKVAGADANEVKIAELELYGTGISNSNLEITGGNGEITSEYPGKVNEDKDKLIDKSENSKYYMDNFLGSAWVCYQSTTPVTLIGYSITSANDFEERDPKAWTLEASNDGENWTVIDSRKDQSFIYRLTTQYYSCNEEKLSYTYYRLNVTENKNGDGGLQFSEWQLFIKDGPVGVQETSMFDIAIYPNPVGDYLQINMPDDGIIQIYNLSGQLELVQEVQRGLSTIPVRSLKKGVYVVRIQTNDKVVNQKISKQ